MDEDVPMDEGSKPQDSKPSGNDLSQYNLDDYDNDEAMPGTSLSLVLVLRGYASSPRYHFDVVPSYPPAYIPLTQAWVLSVT